MTVFEGSIVRHGTISGFKRHYLLGEEACEVCRVAKREYDKRWLQGSGPQRRSRASSRAQGKARGELSRNHPEEYRELYIKALEVEFENEGIEK